MDTETLVTAIKQYLKNEDIDFLYDDSKNRFTLLRGSTGILNYLRHYLRVSDNGFTSTLKFPIKAPEDSRTEVVKYLNSINWKLRASNFEMDSHDGEVQIRMYVDAEGLNEISEAMIENAVYIPSSTIRNYSENILRIMMSNSTAEKEEAAKDDDHPLRGIHSLEQIKKKLEALQASLASDESEDDEGEETSEE